MLYRLFGLILFRFISVLLRQFGLDSDSDNLVFIVPSAFCVGIMVGLAWYSLSHSFADLSMGSLTLATSAVQWTVGTAQVKMVTRDGHRRVRRFVILLRLSCINGHGY